MTNDEIQTKKILAGVLGIVLGALGIHKFVLGQTASGIIMLLITVLSLGFLSFIPGIIGLIEGIIYLTKPNDVFHQQYIAGNKGWF
ncbi:MAG: TM2 domain-containing protein [Planctomycetota bacterium]